jgi:superfamily II DNA or RNA helicase
MSVRVLISDLTPEQKGLIRKHLFLQPQSQNFAAKALHFQETKDPVLFYHVVGEYIYLPYTFAAALFQKASNHDFSHPEPPEWQYTGTLYEHQKEILPDAESQLQTKGATTLGVYPGFGKTILGAYLGHRLKELAGQHFYIAVLFYRDFLATQWKETFEKNTTATVWIVGTPAPRDMPTVTLCMDTKVNQLSEEYRRRIGLLIIDEAHTLCTPSRVECLLNWQPKYIIAETATLERADGMHSMIQHICGLHGIFKSSTKQFSVVRYNTAIVPETKANARGGLDWISLIKNLALNPIRNKYILDFVLCNLDKKILILASLKEHIKILYEALQEANVKTDFMAGTKKTYSDSQVLLGTLSKIGTGFDEKTACPDFNGIRINMLLLVTSVKSPTLIEQSVGRVFRADMPIVIDFVDSNSTVRSHWYQRKKWYVSRNGQITEINAPKNNNVGVVGTAKQESPTKTREELEALLYEE